MNAIGEKLMDKAAAVGVAVTGGAWFADSIQIVNGIGEVVLTWVGVGTGLLTGVYYLTKLVDWLEQRKRNAKVQRNVEDETSDL